MPQPLHVAVQQSASLRASCTTCCTTRAQLIEASGVATRSVYLRHNAGGAQARLEVTHQLKNMRPEISEVVIIRPDAFLHQHSTHTHTANIAVTCNAFITCFTFA